MEFPHATPSESPFGIVKPSSSFFTKPIRVAPLNIATKHQQQHQRPSLTASVKMMSPTSFASSPHPFSTQTPRPSLSSQTFLEANVRLLCDMVDTIMRTNESDQKMLRIEVSQHPTTVDMPTNALEPSCNDPKSPLYILSPKSFTQAKSDISKLDDSVVSKLNSNTLLDLFPTPPPLPSAAPHIPSSEPTNNNTTSITSAIPHLAIPILDRPTTIIVSPTTSWSCPSEDSGDFRPRKGSKQHRNWVISSGLFVSTSETAATSTAGTEEREEENDSTHPKGALIHGSKKMTETEASKGGCHLAAASPPPGIISPASSTTTTAATMSAKAAPAAVLPRPLVARRSLRQEKNHLSFSSTVGSALPAPLVTANLGVASSSMERLPINANFSSSNNNMDTPCSASTIMSPFSSMDALSQSLLEIETQMRRPSFLMNRRTSILSTLFATNSLALDQYDRSEQPSPFPSIESLTVESAEVEPSTLFFGVPKERHETKGAGPLDSLHCTFEPVQAMDWRAWHGSWIRRRIKPEDDGSVLSPTSPAPCSSYSSTRSWGLLSPTSPAPRSSYSSTRSSSSNTCTSPNITLSPATTLVKRLSQRIRRPRMLTTTSPTSTLSSSASSPLAAFASSPMSTFYSPFALPTTPTTPTKDANPELWENEGQKWGDRFQSLLNNFQPNSTSSSSALPPLPPTPSSPPPSSNGKPPKKRWADILPKNRWNKWSSSRTSSSPSPSSRSSSDSERA
ncbi:hypothetical protein KI688_002212 [Linnemannia hyalina]|uniref:Uncharacterized protein n=1 Tax=Linnemannia hyalina TaxID=64524 RepID=A0A9P7XRC1_9FUNG|nr:hypothetical protein KI688_002212 [Linnemannia hyalina]